MKTINLENPEVCAECNADLAPGSFAVLFDLQTEIFICCHRCAREVLTDVLKDQNYTFPAFVGGQENAKALANFFHTSTDIFL